MAKCRKICFPSETEAQEYVTWRRQFPGGRNFRRVRFYQCQACGNWHFTRMTVAEFERHSMEASK